jgi:hypothetical protein
MPQLGWLARLNENLIQGLNHRLFPLAILPPTAASIPPSRSLNVRRTFVISPPGPGSILNFLGRTSSSQTATRNRYHVCQKSIPVRHGVLLGQPSAQGTRAKGCSLGREQFLVDSDQGLLRDSPVETEASFPRSVLHFAPSPPVI